MGCGQVFGERLPGEQPVEGIPVMEGKGRDSRETP